MTGYEFVFRHALQHLDAETAHHLGARVIRTIGRARPGLRVDPVLEQVAMGLRFPTPFGIAAGFDKDATMIAGLGALGFGHVEVGTLTWHQQPGNPRPRLARLVDDRAIVNRMGFNNGGARAAVDRIAQAREASSRPVIGVNIGKSRVVDAEDLEAVVADYRASARALAPVADYLAVNVSSPNTPGLRGLQEEASLTPILEAVLEEAAGVPVAVKIAPDLDDVQVDGVGELALSLGLAGIAATNTTISRSGLRSSQAAIEAAGAGGLSGPPLAARSLEVLERLSRLVADELSIISVGGVSTGADVRERLAGGASLVQGYTGFIYGGIGWARRINLEVATARHR